jgi:hypothetical protein
MTTPVGVSGFLRKVVSNFVPLAVMWVIGFALVQTGEHFSAPVTLKETGQLFGIIVGAYLAWKLQGRVALFLLAILFAEIGSLLMAHLYYRVDSVNGGPVQATILLASLLGVVVGAVMSRNRAVATA